MESAVGKELKVIDVQTISDTDWGGPKPPQFEYRGNNCPLEIPQALHNAFADATKRGEKFYAFVLRRKVVKAVEITCLTDLFVLKGPYFGCHAARLLDEEDEAEGMGTAGDELGSKTGLFIPWSGYAQRTLNGLTFAAIEGTKEYDYYIDENGDVRTDDPAEGCTFCVACGDILDASQSSYA